MVDGVQGADLIADSKLIFSADSKHVAYAGYVDEQFNRFIGWDEKVFHSDSSTFALSPNGEHLAFRDNDRMVLDGAPGPKLDRLFGDPKWNKDGTLEYLAAEKNGADWNLIRVIVTGLN